MIPCRERQDRKDSFSSRASFGKDGTGDVNRERLEILLASFAGNVGQESQHFQLG